MKRSLMSKTILAVLALVMVLSLLPMAAMAAPVTHEIDASTLEAFEKADGQIGTSKALDDYFTLYLGEKTRVDGSNKTFDDGFVGSQRINFQGKTMFNDDGVQNCLQFTAEGAGKVKIWMVGGDAERYVTLFDAAGEVVSQDTGAIEKNAMYIKELEIPAAGTYYLGNTSGSNYFFKVEVTVEVVEEEPVKENKVLDFGDKSFTTDKWVYNQAITAAEAGKLQMVIYDKSFDGTVETNGWGAAIVLDKYGKLVKIYDAANMGFWTVDGKSADPLTFKAADYSTVAFSELADGETLIIFPNDGVNAPDSARVFALSLRGAGGTKAYCGELATLTGFTFEVEQPPVVEPPVVDPDVPEHGDTTIFFVMALMTVAMTAVVVLTKKNFR